MTAFGSRALKSLEVARSVYRLLAERSIRTAVIGSVALAAHGHVRATRDLDFGVCTLALEPLMEVAEHLRAQGHEVEVSEPSADDPLGGVVTISGPDFDPVQIVNLRSPGGRHAKLAREALDAAQELGELGLPVVDLPHLVALKLVAGSRKDELDVVELLRANPTAPLDEVAAVCARHRLRKQLERALESP